LGNEEERDKKREKWLKLWLDDYRNFKRFGREYSKNPLFDEEEMETEERNDVYIYKTLRYPPKSTPPTAN
jgi:hypothetical protein